MGQSARKQRGIAKFGDVLEPDEAAEPILGRPVREALGQWLGEIFSRDALLEVGVKPRTKAIFDGKPGVGKTTLAHHLAARLGLSMLVVRPERLIDKYVGSTGQNLGALFDAVKAEEEASGEPIVLFFDEFDALGAQRRSETSQGSEDERNNYTNTLLQRIEQHDGFIIAATNFAESIDQAIWRRFHIHITLDLPGQGEREAILERYLAPFGLPDRALRELAISLETASPALIREFCDNLKRQIVLIPVLDLDGSKESTISRILATCHPHHTAGKPRLWARGAADGALEVLPWPLPWAADVIKGAEEPPAPPADEGNVTQFPRRP